MARTAQRFISSQIYMMPHVHSSTPRIHGELSLGRSFKRVASRPGTKPLADLHSGIAHEHAPTADKVLSYSLAA